MMSDATDHGATADHSVLAPRPPAQVYVDIADTTVGKMPRVVPWAIRLSPKTIEPEETASAAAPWRALPRMQSVLS